MRPRDKERALDLIRTDPSTLIILISFRAGSTGLNLVSCNHVILLDMWWNPALEDQAFDRAHRLGQTRPVEIHKLTIEDTVEDRMLLVSRNELRRHYYTDPFSFAPLQLQETKRKLADAALEGRNIKMQLTMQDILDLFRRDHRREARESGR